jgi:hypothetical protein
MALLVMDGCSEGSPSPAFSPPQPTKATKKAAVALNERSESLDIILILSEEVGLEGKPPGRRSEASLPSFFRFQECNESVQVFRG